MQNATKNFGIFLMALLLVSPAGLAQTVPAPSTSGGGSGGSEVGVAIACPITLPICPSGSDIRSYTGPDGCPIFSCEPRQTNLPPVINGMGGPSELKVSETGTWSVSAYDPENGQLTYYVSWGDEKTVPITTASLKTSAASSQASTFTHSYSSSGTYTVRFTVVDDKGASAQSSITVNVAAQAEPEKVADLAVDSVSAKPTGSVSASGREYSIYAVIRNAGTAASDKYDLEVYFDSKYDSKGSGYAPLNPGETLGPSSLTGGNKYFAPGAHSVKFAVKPYGKDASSANNEMSQDFYVDSIPTANQPPVINSITAPTSLKVNEAGTWTVNANDPDGKQLSYSVTWGDEKVPVEQNTVQAFTQTATFTHSYGAAGTYTITFTVQDDQGATATSTQTISVASTAPVSYYTCYDSDEENYYNKGKVTLTTNGPSGGQAFTSVDSCTGEQQLTEWICVQQGTANEYWKAVYYTCPSGYSCKDGACVYGSSNQPPFISTVTSPISLKVGETGTVSVNAYDPEGGYLTYSVKWGDGTGESQQYSGKEKTSTAYFSHAYSSSGTYSVSISVTDDKGASTSSDATISVTGVAAACTDSDGTNVYTKGTVTHRTSAGSVLQYQDYCSPNSPSTVFEYVCQDNLPNTVGYACPSGYYCSDGACVQNPVPQPINTASTYVAGRPTLYSNSLADAYIVEFSDFQCPFCSQVQSTLQKIADNYGTRVNFVHMNFPLSFHENAQKAAEAVECAGLQGKYWEMHKVLFANQNDLSFSQLKKYAAQAGVADNGKFESCLATGMTASLVSSQYAEGERIGISSTPSFVIGRQKGSYVTGTKLEGAQSYDEFKKAVETALSSTTPSVNQPPVISGVSSPTILKANEIGIWEIKAYDPENGRLSYFVNWGDDKRMDSPYAEGQPAAYSQSTSFTHSYSSAGIYTVTFTVQDEQGATARSTVTVNVQLRAVPYTPALDVNVAANPSEVKLYDSFQVLGTIAYKKDDSKPQTEQKFKVVTTIEPVPAIAMPPVSQQTSQPSQIANSSVGVSTSAPITIRLERANGNQQMLNTILQYFGYTTSTQEVAAEKAQQEKTMAVIPSVSVVNAAEDTSNSAQKRIDYITLAPGESTSVSAYFTANRAGTLVARVKVYKQADCATVDTSNMGNTECYGGYLLVSEGSAYVYVSGKTEPPQAASYIRVQKGWNMVSVPVAAKVSMEKMARECNTASYAWRLGANGYVKEDTIAPGYGYWVKASSDCDFAVSGDAYTGEPAALSSGWNLVGAPGSEASISDYSGTCQITSGPWYYSKDSNSYAYASALSPAKAYWIKVASACRLGYGDETPPAPPQ